LSSPTQVAPVEGGASAHAAGQPPSRGAGSVFTMTKSLLRAAVPAVALRRTRWRRVRSRADAARGYYHGRHRGAQWWRRGGAIRAGPARGVGGRLRSGGGGRPEAAAMDAGFGRWRGRPRKR